MKNKILILGSNGLVGSSLVRTFNGNKNYEVIKSTRQDANLFSLNETTKRKGIIIIGSVQYTQHH